MGNNVSGCVSCQSCQTNNRANEINLSVKLIYDAFNRSE